MSLRTGVVGAGVVAKNSHLPSVNRNPRTELVGVCDADGARVREAAASYRTTPYADVETMLADADLDWLHVATPVQTHYEIAVAAVEAGVPVTVQKPAVTTLDELERLRSLARRRSVPVSVVHNWLYYPVVRRLRRRIDAGELGDIVAVETTVSGEGRPDETYRGSWVFDLAGGEFEEGMPHPLYLTFAVGGVPADADALDVRTQRTDEYEYDVAYDGTTLQYASRSGALCSVTFLARSAPNHQIRVYGTEQSVAVDVQTGTLEVHDAEEGPYEIDGQLDRGILRTADSLEGLASTLITYVRSLAEEELDLHTERSVDSHYYLLNEVAKALERGKRPPVPLERSRPVLAAMEAVREAAARPSPKATERSG